MLIPLWIIAVCALLWTLRMVTTEWLGWISNRYAYTSPPAWVTFVARVLSGKF